MWKWWQVKRDSVTDLKAQGEYREVSDTSRVSRTSEGHSAAGPADEGAWCQYGGRAGAAAGRHAGGC